MRLSRSARIALGVVMTGGLAIVYLPLLVVLVSSFNTDKTFGWPPAGFTTEWWSRALDNPGARQAVLTSVKAGLGATLVAIVLGSMVAFAVSRYRFFGRESVSLLIVLPIALPGIITGIALNTAFSVLGVQLGLLSVVIGHATFCIVVVFNNVVARLRRTGTTYEEASADLGADPFTTFRRVTFPQLRSALAAGGLLAFALSFDEIIVTTFTAGPSVQTLPIWIFTNIARPNQAPVVTVVAAVLIVLAIVPVWLAQRISADTAGGRL